MLFLKKKGFSDRRIAKLLKVKEDQVRARRHELGIRPVYKRVDTCAGEFPTDTAYMYSTYEEESEVNPSDRRKIMILGGGPNRIGQGIEFDYCCVHASMALREDGYETIMVNCNPETVSTDYDTSDRLYFEPVTLEDVLEIIDVEKPEASLFSMAAKHRLNSLAPWKPTVSTLSVRLRIPLTLPKTVNASSTCCRISDFISPLTEPLAPKKRPFVWLTKSVIR